MRKNVALMMALFCLLVSQAFAQVSTGSAVMDIPQVAPASPNAAALGKYGDIPVGLYTGVPDVNVPLFDVTIGKFSMPLSLGYHASGLKVEEQASWVGLGWVLNAGGVITRAVHKGPDEGSNGYFSHTGWTLDSINTPLRALEMGIADLEPDFFSYNFAGRSGRFIIDNSTGNKPHLIPFEPLEITFPKRLDSFTVRDERGISYVFNAPEFTFNDGNGNPTVPYKSSWYLSRIKTPWGDAVLEYQDDPDELTVAQRSSVDYTLLGGTCKPISPVNSTSITTTDTKILKKITTPLYVITFFSSTNRQDMPGFISKMDSLQVADYNGHVLRRFSMDYSYFGNTTTTDYNQHRLKLDAVNEKGTQAEVKRTTFDYNAPTGVPAIDSKGQDYWGYYNGHAGSTLLPAVDTVLSGRIITLPGADRSPDFSSAVTGMLTKITYPTGGSTEFTYEGNTYGALESQTMNQLVEIATESTASALNVTGMLRPADSSLFTIGYDQENVRVYFKTTTDGPRSPDLGPSVYVNKIESNGARTSYFKREGVLDELSQTVHLPAGNYVVRATVDGSGQGALAEVFYHKHTPQSDTLKLLPAGGIRIKEIITRDGVTNTVQSKQFKYTTKADPARSSGNLVSKFNFTEIKGGINTPTCPYLVRTSYPASSMSMTHGSPVGYSFVTTTINNGAGGRTEDSYTCLLQNGPVLEYQWFQNGLDTWGKSAKYVDDVDFQRGLISNESVFDATGKLLQSKDYTYTFNTAPTGNPNSYQAQAITTGSFPVCDLLVCDNCGGPFRCDDFTKNNYSATAYRIICPWTYTSRTRELLYDQASATYIENITSSYYDNPAHAQLTKTVQTDSDADTIITLLKYPQDYALSGTVTNAIAQGIKNLQTTHTIAPVIEKVVQRKTPAGAVTTLSAQFTSYKATQPFPDYIYRMENAGEVTGFTPTVVTATAATFYTLYKPYLQFVSYDATGNVLTQQKVNGLPENYLWGYHGQYPVAQVLGGTYAAAAAFVNASVLQNPASDAALRTELNKIRSGYAAQLPMVTTYTYAPGIGVTSSTDPKNRSTFYEYDGLARLTLVRDQDNNILKMMCYNLAGQSTACQSYYGNAVQSRSFTGGSCTNGFTPGSVTYSVAANTYRSFVSQAVADSVAIADVVANGPAYAAAHPNCLCTGVSKKVVKGKCETATRVNTSTVKSGSSYICTYHWLWSDGSVSQNYTETNSFPCLISPLDQVVPAPEEPASEM